MLPPTAGTEDQRLVVIVIVNAKNGTETKKLCESGVMEKINTSTCKQQPFSYSGKFFLMIKLQEKTLTHFFFFTLFFLTVVTADE